MVLALDELISTVLEASMPIANCLTNSRTLYSEIRTRFEYLIFMAPTMVRVHYYIFK